MSKAVTMIIPALFLCVLLSAQERLNPAVHDFGGIYDIPDADIKPNPNLDYKIVIDVKSGSIDNSSLNPALNNVARLLNLHAIGGASPARTHVVLAVHAGASYALLNDEAYRMKYGIDNPNTPLLEALKDARVDITICGQSMIGRDIGRDELFEGVKVGTSMLTTVTTYQSLGYSFLQF